MRLLSLIDATDTLPIPHERFRADREDLEVEDGQGGYRSARADETRGKILVRFDSRDRRRAGLTVIGRPAYCRALTEG